MKRELAALFGLMLTTMLFSACVREGEVVGQELSQPEISANGMAIDPITIRFGHTGPDDANDLIQYGAEAFASKVLELSRGTMEVRIYPAGQLGNIDNIIEMLQEGELHMGDIENAPLTSVVPETVWIDLPYVIQSYEHAQAVMDARSEVSRWIRPLFVDNGLRVLGNAHGGFRHMINNVRPINHPDDMNGLTMRSMASPAMYQSMVAFGSEPILIPLGTLYEALRTGMADGWENAFSLVYSMRFYEVQRYLSLTGHFYNPRNYIFSEALWQEMTPAQQLVVLDATEYATDSMNQHLFAVQEVLFQNLVDNGMIVNELSSAEMDAFRSLGTTVVWPQFYEAIGSGSEAHGRVIIDMILSYAQ